METKLRVRKHIQFVKMLQFKGVQVDRQVSAATSKCVSPNIGIDLRGGGKLNQNYMVKAGAIV